MWYATNRHQIRYKIRKFFRQLTWKDFSIVGNIIFDSFASILFLFLLGIIIALCS